jgi:hypothetical protein
MDRSLGNKGIAKELFADKDSAAAAKTLGTPLQASKSVTRR